jgi:peptide/nickel transport system permease protein
VWRFCVQRLLLSVPVLFLLSGVVFGIMHAALGDPVSVMVGQETVDPGTRQAMRATLGLDRPIHVQYLDWLTRMLRGDLGRSFTLPMSVTEAIRDRLPVTLELSGLALGLALVTGLPIGIAAALRRHSAADITASGVAAVGISLPSFSLGILLIFLFALRLRWLPSAGFVPVSEGLGENLRHMVLPTISLSAWYLAIIARFMRETMAEVLREPFILVARSKGLSGAHVVLRHALRNCLVPLITVLGFNMPGLVAGSVITETIFALPGIGRLLADAILGRDIAVVQGIVVLVTLLVVTTNLVVGIGQAYADPRIRYRRAEAS